MQERLAQSYYPKQRVRLSNWTNLAGELRSDDGVLGPRLEGLGPRAIPV